MNWLGRARVIAAKTTDRRAATVFSRAIHQGITFSSISFRAE